MYQQTGMANAPNADNSKVNIQPADRSYKAVGRCIYCQSVDKPLTDEHIIPLGLGGNLVLPQSSCVDCAKITGRFEMDVLRFNLAGFRSRLGFPSRRPKDRFREEKLTFVHPDGSTFQKKVSLQDHPVSLVLPLFEKPGLVLGSQPADFKFTRSWVQYQDEELKRITEKYNASIQLSRRHQASFARMFAKIAHSWMAAERGLGNFEPLLPPIILGKDPNLAFFVGGEMKSPGDVPPIDARALQGKIVHYHKLSSSEQVCRLPNGAVVKVDVVEIQLIAFAQTPKYFVVSGILP